MSKVKTSKLDRPGLILNETEVLSRQGLAGIDEKKKRGKQLYPNDMKLAGELMPARRVVVNEREGIQIVIGLDSVGRIKLDFNEDTGRPKIIEVHDREGNAVPLYKLGEGKSLTLGTATGTIPIVHKVLGPVNVEYRVSPGITFKALGPVGRAKLISALTTLSDADYELWEQGQLKAEHGTPPRPAKPKAKARAWRKLDGPAPVSPSPDEPDELDDEDEDTEPVEGNEQLTTDDIEGLVELDT